MNTEVRVKEAINQKVIVIEPHATVADAAMLMANNNIGSVVVVEGENPIGIITERDITYSVAAIDLKPSLVTVKNIMSKNLKIISPNDILTKASKIMVKYNIRRLPVIENGKLVGIISNKDILAIAPSQIEVLRELATMNHEKEDVPKEAPEWGTCENCGDYGVKIQEVNGIYVCDTCKEELEE